MTAHARYSQLTSPGANTPAGAARHRRRRGFTLVEVTLAAMLGVLIIATAIAIFGAMRRGFGSSMARAEAANERARLHTALQQCFRQVVLLPKPRSSAGRARTAADVALANATGQPTPPASSPPTPIPQPPGTGGPGTTGVGAGDSLAGQPRADGSTDDTDPASARGGRRAPRLILEQDPAGVQRLELVTTQSPLAVQLRDGSWSMPTPEAGGGVRGAFELRPNPDGRGYDIWWRLYELASGPTGQRWPLGEVRIARGFVRLQWKFVKSDENKRLQWLTSALASDPSEIPAYVELEAQTADGFKAKWMFEIGWLMAREQDAQAAIPADLARRFGETDPITGRPIDDDTRLGSGSGTGPGGGPLAGGGGTRGGTGGSGPGGGTGGAGPGSPGGGPGPGPGPVPPWAGQGQPWGQVFGPDGRPMIRR